MADDVAAAYRVLGLKPGATPEQVKHAYRDLIKTWHPDRLPNDERLRSQAHTKSAELNAAYGCVQEHLRNPAADPKPGHQASPSAPPPSKQQVQSPHPRPRAAPTRPPVLQHERHPAGPCQDLAHLSVVLGTVGLLPGALLAGLAVAIASLVRPDGPVQGIAMGLSVAALVVGLSAITMAGIAMLGLPKREAALHRKAAVRGLVLGGISVIAGAAILLIGNLISRQWH